MGVVWCWDIFDPERHGAGSRTQVRWWSANVRITNFKFTVEWCARRLLHKSRPLDVIKVREVTAQVRVPPFEHRVLLPRPDPTAGLLAIRRVERSATSFPSTIRANGTNGSGRTRTGLILRNGESCAPAALRLRAEGISLDGLDVDHVWPWALGGADHPLNYQLLDSSLNRSLGAGVMDKIANEPLATLQGMVVSALVSLRCGRGASKDRAACLRYLRVRTPSGVRM